MKPYKLVAGTGQHIGNRPQQNDRTAVLTGSRAPDYVLAVLSDGLTGGATASEQVLHTAQQVFDTFKPGDNPSTERLSNLLREIVHEAHMIIRMNEFTTKTESHATFVALLITPGGKAIWAHVGDSRLYRFASGKCMARSSDAPYIEHLVSTDKIPLDAAKNHRHSKLLLNVLGNDRKEPFVTIGVHEQIVPGDSFLLCTDGLWHFFTDAELAAVIGKTSPRQASEMLINKATERAQGKGDNLTMCVVKFVKPPREAKAYTVQKMGRAV
ncbi:MAG: PP2C family serine/threonine-protein phosphatase [Pseudomonadota bacterium]